MTKPISARVHGVLDYATVAAFLNAPMVFGFHGTPAAIVYWLAGLHLLMTGFTDFPLGLFKMIPFRVHGVIDLLVGIFLLVSPWLFGFAGENAARNFFIAIAIITFVVVALTDYSQRVEIPPRAPGDRREWRGGTAR
ncbi:MAG TPA: SPW repeat protein [Gemmatimonadaceae bacterium]|nr:SPW repeat protein [Gemmatimonadaceae bacterium]